LLAADGHDVADSRRRLQTDGGPRHSADRALVFLPV
jgi:hypothetical protein